MAGQICETCKYKNALCYCSPNSCCTEYEEEQKITIGMLEDMEDIMIRASRKAELTRNQLMDTCFKEGILAVYNLGMEHMYEYLKGENDEETV